MTTTEHPNTTAGQAVAAPVDRDVGRPVPERDTAASEMSGLMSLSADQEAEARMLRCQVASLRAALLKVLDTREKEAKAWFAYETARDNYSGGARLESRRHVACMTASSEAEKEARLLLATMKTPNASLTGRPRAPSEVNDEHED